MRRGPICSLRKKRDFEVVFKKGLKSASKYLVIYARLNELDISRLGLSVSKKVGKAVIRNKIKRLLREALVGSLEGIRMHCDFVIVAKKSSVEAGLTDLVLEIKRLLPRLIHEKDSNTIHNTV